MMLQSYPFLKNHPQQLVNIFTTVLLFLCHSVDGQQRVWPKTDIGIFRLSGHVRYVDESMYSIEGGENKEVLFGRRMMKFDAKGNMLEHIDTVYLGKNHATGSKTVYGYGSDGRCSTEIQYVEGALVSKIVHRYDSRGNNILDNKFNANNSLEERTVLKYNKSGDLIADSAFDANNTLLDTRNCTYDNFHNKLVSDMFSNGSNSHLVNKRRYDQTGNEVEGQRYYKGRLSATFTFKYEEWDKAGNWQVKKEYSEGSLTHVNKRTIKYW